MNVYSDPLARGFGFAVAETLTTKQSSRILRRPAASLLSQECFPVPNPNEGFPRSENAVLVREN